MRGVRHAIGCALLVIMLATAGCSPEASRTRSSGAGGDIGNRGPTINMHGQTNPDFNTPAVGRAINAGAR